MITFILGGARSGKSSFAEHLAVASGETLVTYIATADSKDAEMEARIASHKRGRPESWATWEGEPERLPDEIGRMEGTLLLDCLTMYLSRLFFADPMSETEDEAGWQRSERSILAKVEEIYKNFKDAQQGRGRSSRLIVVSNEVGLGLVPSYPMGRRFRDMQGRANQLSAAYADDVALVVAGLPLWIKGGLH